MTAPPQLVVLGDGGVGKTSIILRYTRNQFSEQYEPTLEDNYKATIELQNGQKLDIDIADTAGQDDYKSLRDRYMDVGNAFLIVYSVTDARTLNTAKERLSEIKTLKENNFKFLLVGNKCDMPSRNVTFDDGKKVAEEFGGKFMETSAKKVININEAFQEIGMLLNQTEQVSGGCACRI